MLELKSNTTIDLNGQTISGNGQMLQYTGLQNVTVKNGTIDNLTIKLTDCSSIAWSSIDWQNCPNRCLDMYGRIASISVTNCSFTNCSGDSCLFCTNGQIIDGNFNDNKFNNCNHGMHFSWGGTKQRNDVKIQRNVFQGILVFCLEMQNGVTGLLIANNWSGNYRSRNSRMDNSIATGPIDGISKTLGGTGIEIRDNWYGNFDRPQPYQDAYACIELMGIGNRVHHNAALGPRGCFVLSGWDDPSTQVDHNIISGLTDTAAHFIKEETQGVPSTAAMVYSNQFPASIDVPTPDQVTQGKCWWQTTGSGNPNVIAPAVAVDPNAPSMILTPRPGVAGILDIVLKNTPVGKIQRRATRGDGTWFDVSTVIAGPCSLADAGPAFGQARLPTNWEIDERLVDLNGNQVVLATAQVNSLPIPDDVTAAYLATQSPIPSPTPSPSPTATPDNVLTITTSLPVDEVVINGKKYALLAES